MRYRQCHSVDAPIIAAGSASASIDDRERDLFPCGYALQPSIPRPARSALHRCSQSHGIYHLPDVEGGKPKRQRFERYPIGFLHIDISDVQTAEGML